MPFIRLSDNYIDHPKFLALSASAFRLWHEGMAFCRKHQTDGLIPTAALQGFRYYKTPRVDELTTPYLEGKRPLWETIAGFGYKVHDYLQWNPSKEDENKRRDESKERMSTWRGKKRQAPGYAVTGHITNAAPTALVLDMDRKSHSSFKEEKDEDVIGARAGWLLNRYEALYREHRTGARYRRKESLDFPRACDLVRTWPENDRLEKLAVLVLTTNDDWISTTDRGFGVFASKASWADDKLRQWEVANGVEV